MEHKLLSCVNNSNESLKGMRDFFICEHCEGESFDEIRLLKKHKYDATGTISKCDDCDFASNDVPSIVEHVREAHKPVHQCHLEPQPVSKSLKIRSIMKKTLKVSDLQGEYLLTTEGSKVESI